MTTCKTKNYKDIQNNYKEMQTDDKNMLNKKRCKTTAKGESLGLQKGAKQRQQRDTK